MKDFAPLRAELSAFYGEKLHPLHEADLLRGKAALRAQIADGLPAIRQKQRQYGIIAETVTPVLFRNTAFYGEICGNEARESPNTLGKWTYDRNIEAYRQYGAAVLAERDACASFPLYTFCGLFGDEQYHFAFESEKILRSGFRGIYEKTLARMKSAQTDDERAWLDAVAAGLLAVKRVAERFAEKATQCARAAAGEEKMHYQKIAATAARIPWEKPQTFCEALETVFFMQGVCPILEGAKFSTVGRLDYLLGDFYRRDLQAGILTREAAYDAICEFMLLYDLRIPHDAENQSDSLVGAVITLGGVDAEGNAVYNPVTELFLQADEALEIIYPKLKCRFDRRSPKAYLAQINTALRKGQSTLLYENDDALIPALVRSGVSLPDARGYSVLGCWEPVIPGCTNEHCAYFSTVKIFELSVHGGMRHPDLPFEIQSLENAQSFEEVLQITLQNFHSAMDSRCRVATAARRSLHLVDPHPLLSSLLDDCLARGRDVTDGGAKYAHDEIICAGLPNVLDSLLAIKTLCFEKKTVSLPRLLQAVRENWPDEALRRQALACPFFGDNGAESNALAKRITDDFAAYAETLPSLWGGRVVIGYMLFMEMYRMANSLRATPDGRHSGDYFARGLTPSVLHRTDSVTDVLNCFAALDASGMAANNVLNVTLPFAEMSLDIWEAMVRRAAESAVGALQINCASREELLDAVAHPEAHESLIVRVCGYSARFNSLPDHVKQDFLSRNVFRARL